MNTRKTSLERAFEIAKSGKAETISDIRLRLRKEGYEPEQIEGRQLQDQLRALIRTARG